MKVTIEFELPVEQDAYFDAVEGSRWRDFAQGIELFLILLEATEANLEAQRAFHHILQHMRQERAAAGLTFLSSQALRELWDDSARRYADQLNKHLREQGLSSFADKRPE
jgi:hypothetical protein